jgi:pimeloyl-ACP methyl ester carboxylesterase
MPVLPLHGPRRSGRTSGERFLDGDILDTIHAEACAVWDLRRILAWIRAQEPAGIGVYGLSLGGYNAALLAALEPELSCVVAGIPAVDLLQLAMLHTPSPAIQCAERAGMCWPHVGEVLSVIAPLSMRPKVSHDRLYVFAGSCDRIVPPQQAVDLWTHWQRPHLAWYGGGHFSFRWAPAAERTILRAIEQTMLQPKHHPTQSIAA